MFFVTREQYKKGDMEDIVKNKCKNKYWLLYYYEKYYFMIGFIKFDFIKFIKHLHIFIEKNMKICKIAVNKKCYLLLFFI